MSIEGAKELGAELAAARKGKTKPVYLVHGTEGYLVRTASDALAKVLAEASGAEIVRLDAAGQRLGCGTATFKLRLHAAGPAAGARFPRLGLAGVRAGGGKNQRATGQGRDNALD